MAWHLSRENPMKVYDERHTEICVCITVEAAALIVAAVNRLRGEVEPRDLSVKLREPETLRNTHVTQAEGCCGRQIGKASLAGKLETVTRFECPTCGTAYDSRTEGPVTLWEARADALVFKI
jgi:predicted RNA-binding Zn-ribbon protein involved in translation (DUF1610 family)